MSKFMAITKLHMYRMLHRIEGKLAITATMLLFLAAFVTLGSEFAHDEYGSLPSAAVAWIGNKNIFIVQALSMWFSMLIFLFASIMYADHLAQDRKRGITGLIAVRTKGSAYITSGAFTSFMGGFLVTFVPLLLFQLIAMAVYPLESTFGMNYDPVTPIFKEYSMRAAEITFFPTIFFKMRYLNNLIFMISTSIIAGAVATISYSISLYTRLRSIFILGIPVLVIRLMELVFPLGLILRFYLYPNYSSLNISIYIYLMYLIGLPLLAALLVWIPVRLKRDVLA